MEVIEERAAREIAAVLGEEVEDIEERAERLLAAAIEEADRTKERLLGGTGRDC